jgi:hypothetical protein
MNPSTEFEFMVGEKYENERGIFKVMSIEKDEMTIQWANGEEAATSMQFQSRIQERRQWETRQKEKTGASKPKSSKAKSSKSSKQEATD